MTALTDKPIAVSPARTFASHYYLVMTVKNAGLKTIRALVLPRNLLAVAVAALFVLFIWFVVSRASARTGAGPHNLADTLRERIGVLQAMAIFVWFDVLFRCTSLSFGGGVGTLARLLGFQRAEASSCFRRL